MRASRGSCSLDFDGEPVPVVPGQSLAAALLAAGHLAQGWAKDGAPRGAFCGMGVCHDCLVTVDSRPGVRACMTKAQHGMQIGRQPARLDLSHPGLADCRAAPTAIASSAIDVLVIGAGPAGLAAAEAARVAGATVLILDERVAPGGQYDKQPATAAAKAREDAQATEGAARIDRVRTLGVAIQSDAAVWGAERVAGGTLVVAFLRAGVAHKVRPRMMVVATGAYEQAPILPGWTLPGVMTTGALQTLLRSDDAVPGRRIVVAGNGPLNLQVAAELLRRGVKPVALIEAAPAPWTRPREALALLRVGPRLATVGLRQLAALHRAGVPVIWNARVARADGETSLERVWFDGGGGPREIEADVLAIGEGLSPANELPRLLGCRHEPDGRGGLATWCDAAGATSLDDVFVVGEAARFGGAAVARGQGTLAGREAARRLGFLVERDDRTVSNRITRDEAFQKALWRLFRTPPPGLDRADGDTILCRCEALTLGGLRQAVSDNAIGDLGTLKRLTRAGMGRCQGRYCGPHLATLIGAGPLSERTGFAPQMPLRPIPLAALAIEKPEWGGHKRSLLPDWTPVAPSEPWGETRADVVVIGAGVAGVATALFLARAGHDVLVVDRAEPNALASGGNAGSLHAQLLSFDHGARAEAGGGPAALTLPLQRESIDLWIALERELGRDFEIRRTGGLMVAETERDLAFLDRKTRVERGQGVDCTVIGASDLRTLEPALWDGFVGAAHCPQEGKINPLVATQGLLDAAMAAGARFVRRTHVLAITADGGRFTIETDRGRVTARRLVNAAGAFAAVVGRMLGAEVPVFGAPLQMVVTEAAAPTIGCLIAHADRHLTLKQAANGTFLIGGGWTAGLDPVHGHPRPLMASLEGNLWVAQHVVPALRKLHVIRSWAAMNINIDGAPILGEDPRVPGLFHAVTSNGYTLGPLVGRITAQLIGRGGADRDVSAFSITRFEGKVAA